MSSAKVLVGVFTGVAIGAVAGILFTANKCRRNSLKGNSQQELAAEVNQLIVNITKRFDAMREETNRVTGTRMIEGKITTRTKLDSL